MIEPSPACRPSAAPALAARRRAIHALRRRVATIAVAVFLAAWGIVFSQLVSGHDPALARDVAPVTTQSADPAVTEDETGAAAASGDSSAAATTAPEPVVTRQS